MFNHELITFSTIIEKKAQFLTTPKTYCKGEGDKYVEKEDTNEPFP
jgi:hypothetical protein